MALNRVWLPSPSYSSRGGATPRLLVVHTTEGASTIESLGNWFANPGNQVSSHTGADDKPNTVGEYVKRPQKAWTQGNANPVAVSIELCAWARWSPAEWDAHPNMLANCAAWLAEESAATGIPLVRLNASQAQGSGRGVCGHVDLGSWGGGHTDPGAGFPWGRVLSGGGGAPSPPAPVPPPAPSGAPPFPGVILRDFTAGNGTATWQARMVARGWRLDVDDQYGPASANVCRQFQAEKGLSVDGEVGPITWNAAWSAPIT